MMQFDVVVIGGGAAGLYTALSLSAITAAGGQGLRVALLTKDNLAISASDWAQGGIAAVMDRQDSVTFHAEDTLKAGAGLCDPAAVEVLVNHAPECIRRLIELGVEFDRHGDQSLAMTLEAAHSHRRVLHAADATGRALVTTLASQVMSQAESQKNQKIKNQKNDPHHAPIEVLAGWLALDLCMVGQRCRGVYCLNPAGQWEIIEAAAVVLATGGGAQVFAQNTNPPASTGDGVAMAWRAGAEIRDMEFVQFHPTALAVAGAPRFLISEAVRGEGAHLVDAKGERFAFRYHPQGELAPRDVVSRAVFRHLQATGEPTAWLDLSPIAPERISYRFPNIIKLCQQWQIDLFTQPIPVTPAAHYCMGGVTTDTWGATSLRGLYAVGETASTGVHGANRLASNSLLECFVFGGRLATAIQRDYGDLNAVTEAEQANLAMQRQCLSQSDLASSDLASDVMASTSTAILRIKEEVQQLMWRQAGISRDGVQLAAALTDVEEYRMAMAALETSQRLWVETRNLLDVAYLMLRSALFRTESRGAHQRNDYPEIDDQWLCHTVVVGETIGQKSLGKGL
ncbi:MAG: L-aspartate oxidase [Pseudanabaenaceae cyanobacterium]|jgi:L-aspartate oxidase